MHTLRILERAAELRARRTPFTLATVVRAHRPTSAHTGDRALVLPDGTIEGFVGGTCAESTVRTAAVTALTTGGSTLLRITPPLDPAPAGTPPMDTPPTDTPPTDTEAWEDGLLVVANPCLSGGTLEIFLEAVLPPPLVHVYGRGPVARALADVGTALGHDVHVTDASDTARADDPVEVSAGGSAGGSPGGSAQPPDDHPDAVIVASHGRDEERVLKAALRADVGYIALVASTKRGAAVLANLDTPGADRVHTPAGLDIGARTAPEIAVSIYAQLIADRPTRTRGTRTPPPETAIDPVCGMTVMTAHSPSRTHDGRTWWFCTPACQDAFTPPPP